MSWGNSSYFEILGSVSSQLEDLSGEVLKDGSGVHSCGRTDSVLLSDPLFEESVDPADGELDLVRWGDVWMLPGDPI